MAFIIAPSSFQKMLKRLQCPQVAVCIKSKVCLDSRPITRRLNVSPVTTVTFGALCCSDEVSDLMNGSLSLPPKKSSMNLVITPPPAADDDGAVRAPSASRARAERLRCQRRGAREEIAPEGQRKRLKRHDQYHRESYTDNI